MTMQEQDYHQAVGEARQRQLDGKATDEDRRYLKQAERDGLDADQLAERYKGKEGQQWDGTSSQPSQKPSEQTGGKSSATRQSPARTTGNRSKSGGAESDTARPETTSGPATAGADEADKTSGSADTAN